MMKFDQRTIGILVVFFSVMLIGMMSLIKADFDNQGAFMCEVVAENPDLSMSQCPAHQSNTSWLIFIVFGASFLILGSGIYLVFFPVNKEPGEFREVDLSKLGSDEKTIFGLLKSREGSMYQSDLITETGFSKVKITRILDRMAAKKILDRKRRGMTNIVVLR